jgi:hypothetical protein
MIEVLLDFVVGEILRYGKPSISRRFSKVIGVLDGKRKSSQIQSSFRLSNLHWVRLYFPSPSSVFAWLSLHIPEYERASAALLLVRPRHVKPLP